MGLFHCPLGALGYGDDGCIQCGLCSAVTRAQKIEATQKMRAWIRENRQSSNPDLLIQKIAVCGKGGSGKSTLTALLSGALEHIGYRTLILDTDSSNGGLYKKLGMDAPPVPLNQTEEGNCAPAFLDREQIYFEEVEEPFVVTNRMRSLVCAGKIEDPLMGCACTIGEYARILIQKLSTQAREIVIADQEAGVESFGRGIEASCDTILIMVEPSIESVELAGKIQYMAQGIGIQRIRAILNKIEDEEQEEFILDRLTEQGVRCLGKIEDSKQIRNRNLFSRELLPEEGFALAGSIATCMLDEAEMTYDRQ